MATLTCWNCQAETRAAPFCPACGKVAARAQDATHFDTFGLPRSVDVDTASLERTYRELSLKLHPDRLGQAEPRERRLSLEQTAALNEGYKVLRDPVRRAFYLLKLSGVDLEREGASERASMPLEFLEEVMGLRERLEEAREAGNLEAAQAMAEDVRKRQQQALGKAQDALRAWLASGDEDSSALQGAALELGRVRYFTRFLEEVAAMEEEALG
jgi:molecular chaperone HscB